MKNTEVFKDDHWEEIEFKDLRKGDKFRVFNPSGQLHKNEEGESIFIATTDAFVNENGLLTINLTHDKEVRNKKIKELNNKLALQQQELKVLIEQNS